MPAAIGGAVLSGFLSGSAIGVFSFTAFAKALVLGGLSAALSPKPKKGALPELKNLPSTVAVRQPDLTRTYAYGHTRVVRGYAHMESVDNNKNLHIILILCQGELRAINEVWLNDYAIPNDWIDANGNVTQGRYKDHLTIRKHLGATNQAADSLAVANLSGWTNEHRLQGIAYLYLIMKKNQDIYPTGVPNVGAIVEGAALYDPRIGANRWSTNIAQFARDFITTTKGFESSVDDVNDTNIAAQMNICDEIVTTNAENFTVSGVDAATDIITLTGDLLTLQYGDRVEVSSTGTLPSGLSALTSYYVIPYQVKDTPRLKLATSLLDSMAGTAINLTTAGTGTITVTKTGEPRYHGGGVVDSESNLRQTLADMASGMAGRAVNIAGAWTLLAGAWRSPTLKLTINDMRGNGISFKNCVSMADNFNKVQGIFRGAPTLWQDTNYPVASYQTFISQDLREQPRDLDLPFVTRPTAAQRIAKIELFKARQDIVINAEFSMKAFQAQPGDTVMLTIDRYGWVQKEFEVTQQSFNINDGALSVNLTLRETAQSIFDWSAGEAIDFDPAPNTTLPDPFNVFAPSGVQYNSTVVGTVGGDKLAILQLEWDLHPDAFVREYGDFELQFKKSADANWLPSFFVDGALTKTDVVTATVGEFYDIRIRARNNLGVRSAWSTLLEVVVGSSGGVTTTDDWRLVSDTISVYKEWGGVADTVSVTEDWGFVA